jgi:hypothetical protein
MAAIQSQGRKSAVTIETLRTAKRRVLVSGVFLLGLFGLSFVMLLFENSSIREIINYAIFGTFGLTFWFVFDHGRKHREYYKSKGWSEFEIESKLKAESPFSDGDTGGPV